jgi:hypothetical protein
MKLNLLKFSFSKFRNSEIKYVYMIKKIILNDLPNMEEKWWKKFLLNLFEPLQGYEDTLHIIPK